MSYLVRIRPEAERDVRDAAFCICHKVASYSDVRKSIRSLGRVPTDTRKSIRPLGRAPTILPEMS